MAARLFREDHRRGRARRSTKRDVGVRRMRSGSLVPSPQFPRQWGSTGTWHIAPTFTPGDYDVNVKRSGTYGCIPGKRRSVDRVGVGVLCRSTLLATVGRKELRSSLRLPCAWALPYCGFAGTESSARVSPRVGLAKSSRCPSEKANAFALQFIYPHPDCECSTGGVRLTGSGVALPNARLTGVDWLCLFGRPVRAGE